MKYALNLADDKRVLSACVVLPTGVYVGMPIVEELPEGNLLDYLYIDGEFIYDPIPKPDESEHQPSQEERITALEAQLAAYEAAYAEGVNEGWA